MPDQRSAAEEYAIFQQITAPAARLPDDPVRVAAEVDFPVARGYDRVAVDAYVQRMSQLVAELGATRSPEGAVQRALERVGAQISGVLQRARDSAEQITAQSRREAEDRLEVTGQEAVQIVAAAAHRVEDLDAEAERIGAERRRLISDACELAGQLIALTDAANRRFPPDEPEASAQFHAADQAAAPEAPEPDLGAESQLAELWTLAAGQAPDDDLTAVLSPVEADPDAVARPSRNDSAGDEEGRRNWTSWY